MADDFALTHKVSFLHANVQDHKKGNKTFVQSKPVSDNRPKTETKPQSTSDASSKGQLPIAFLTLPNKYNAITVRNLGMLYQFVMH